MAGTPASSATESRPRPSIGTTNANALLVLADGTKLLPTGEPRRLAESAWEIPTQTGPRMVRDVDLWFSEGTLPIPAGAAAAVGPLLVGIQLPDRSRIEGNLTGVRIDHGSTWLRWRHEGSESEVRISDAGLARAEISLRAAGVPRLNPVVEPPTAVLPASMSVPPPEPVLPDQDAQPHLVSPGFALLEDGKRLVSDAIPQQLSDGSWHLSVEGHTRVLPLDQVWLIETESAAPMHMIPVQSPMTVDVVLPYGQQLQGDLLNAYVDSEALWMHWRRSGRERTLRIAAPAIAGIEIEMRPPRPTGAAKAEGTGEQSRLPFLRSGADLDAFLAAQIQGEGREIENHLFADLAAWRHCTTDERAADNSFRLAQKLGLTLIDLASIEPSPPALSTLTPELARRHRMVPLRIRQNLIAVATDNPTSAEALSTVEFATAKHVVLLLAHGTALQTAISRYYDRVEDGALLKSLVLGPETDDDDDRTARENERLARQQPIVRLVSALLEDAARRRASDIHVRPREDDFEVLFRIDGGLVPVRSFAKPLLRAVTSRIKVLAGMDISEHRLPQDGRIAFLFEGVNIDIRVSVLPSVNGESIVLRLLNSREGLRNLTQIGFSASDEELFRNMLSRSHGMVLVTGPTGCGKSTTLYAALLEARKQDVNIITVEDPVEYHIPDVTQIQTHKSIGFTFASTLRNILRHDPDVVMVGEIRDRETAEIAVESALTGHLLLSTLHTNSAATTVTRLLDLGVESFLLRSTLLGVLAQRLARRNCRQCMEPENIPPYMRAAMGVSDAETFYRGIGCQHCGGTGIHGRTAVYELMHVDAEIRKLIVANVDGDSVHQRAVEAGMVPITARALALARSGVISLSEAYRIRVE